MAKVLLLDYSEGDACWMEILLSQEHEVHLVVGAELTEESIRQLTQLCQDHQIDIIVFHLPEDFYRLFLDQVTALPLKDMPLLDLSIMADMLQFDDAKRIFFGKLTERGRFCLVQMTKSLEEILAAFNHLLASQPT